MLCGEELESIYLFASPLLSLQQHNDEWKRRTSPVKKKLTLAILYNGWDELTNGYAPLTVERWHLVQVHKLCYSLAEYSPSLKKNQNGVLLVQFFKKKNPSDSAFLNPVVLKAEREREESFTRFLSGVSGNCLLLLFLFLWLPPFFFFSPLCEIMTPPSALRLTTTV